MIGALHDGSLLLDLGAKEYNQVEKLQTALQEKGVRASIHGDDIKLVGKEEDVLEVEKDLQARWTQTRKVLMGPEDHRDKVVLDLNRIVTWTEEGMEIEGDPRHLS